MRNRQVHLDFHTSEAIEGIGEKFSKEQFQRALKVGHVDSITVFSKCHHGWSYHPTKKNKIHPHLKFDLLKAQIEAAHEIGVKTPVYLSGGFDEKHAKEHPEHVAIGKLGDTPDFSKPGYHRLCWNTPYLDMFLEQVEEVLENYDSDGIFVDIVGVHRCFCPNCVKTMQERGWALDDEDKIMQLAEEVYANYAKRIRETIDKIKPGHKLFHNAGHIINGRRDLAFMNTHLELESLPTGGWGYDHFPLSAAYARTLGMEFLGMTGKFHFSWGEFGGFKHPNALRFETALSIANGASCSVGDQLAPSGEMDMVTYNLIGKAYEEIEKIEPWLKEGKHKSDIALLSQESVINYYKRADFDAVGRDHKGNQGASRILLEGQYLFDVADMETDFTQYKVVILPDNIRVDEFMCKKLRDFCDKGGKILATGTSGLKYDKDEYALDFGVSYIGDNEFNPQYCRPCFEIPELGITDYIMYEKCSKIELKDGKEMAMNINPYFNRTAEHFCSHRHSPSSGEYSGPCMASGKDGIVISWNIFTEYATRGSLIAREIVKKALDTLLCENKTFESNLPSKGIATVVEGKDFVRNHLLYCVPIKRGEGIEVVEDITPIFDTKVTIKTEKNIKKVYLVPQNVEIPFEQVGNKVSYTVPKIENHQVVILE